MSDADLKWKPEGQRIPSLEIEEWDERVRALFAPTPERWKALQEGAPRPLHILTTLAHHSVLLEPFLKFASTLTLEGRVPRREAELASLRAAWNCQSEFEWGHHREYGLAAGLSAQEIDRVAVGPEASGWCGLDRAILRAADELQSTQTINDTTWTRLSAHYDSAQLIELLFTIGQYTTLSWITNALKISLEPHLPGLPGTESADPVS